MSKDKKEWVKLYQEAKANGSCYARPADKPFALEHKDFLDAHHIFGRKGERILVFLWITKEKHQDIHDNGTTARLHPNWPRPWPVECEEGWPKKYQRK